MQVPVEGARSATEADSAGRERETDQAILEFDNVVVDDSLQDRDFALEVLEQLGGELAAYDGLDGDGRVRILFPARLAAPADERVSGPPKQTSKRSIRKVPIGAMRTLPGAC